MTDGALRQRLAAILAADAAGYSRLMAADERATVAALDAARALFRAQIEANQGRVVDTAGDSVLAVFETATGAVTAALAIQQSLDAASSNVPEDRRMRFRVGVHLGEIIEKVDGTVYGDGVNIAARLEGLAEPGGVTASDAVRNAVKGKVGAAFEDLGQQSIKNIAEPVRAYRVTAGAAEASTPKRSAADIDLSLPDKPSIAVLPFNNMSPDPEQEFFVDGVTEDIITELSRFHSLFVIARNSTFTYKGKAVDVRTVSKELGVRYVLEGSIRRAGNRIRVTAQLIDSLSGNHIWAEKYDRVIEDVFEVQEEVTRAIVAAIAPQIHASELEKAHRRRPENLSAYEIALRASGSAWESINKSDQSLREQAIEYARRALTIDPRSCLALTTLAFAQWQCLLLYTAPDRKAAFEEALGAVTKAIDVDPSDHNAFAWRAWLLFHGPAAPGWDEALASARRAHELNPNSINSLNACGQIEIYSGNLDIGADVLQAALRVSPRDPINNFVYFGLAFAKCLAAEFASGVEYARHSINATPGFGPGYALLAMNHAGMGELDKAKAAFSTAQSLSPGWIEQRLHGKWPLYRPEDVEGATRLLRLAAGH